MTVSTCWAACSGVQVMVWRAVWVQQLYHYNKKTKT